ncbi:hypothetical protein BB558_000422 [Smittium angustum]|uniref:G-patch domain-containing protein n=1 Tax=Smittium angustum TaxID=133377 RepID=A0A2U1JEI7_SMIAN|nr:hypothetical protein BB558_000422 [Smittium angustum]
MGLAENKSRQLISADPQNLHWGNDKSKFGYRLMQKMGWSEGQGLGASGNGIVDHLKVRLKMNSLGIGAEVKTSENWLENTSDYEKLLAKLNSSTQNSIANSPSTSERESPEPEKKTQDIPKNTNSQPRASHRAKFRKMKQLASKEGQSLQEILGIRKTLETDQVPDIKENKLDLNGAEGFVQTKTSTMNIKEYFSSKNLNSESIISTGEDNSFHAFIGFKTENTENVETVKDDIKEIPKSVKETTKKRKKDEKSIEKEKKKSKSSKEKKDKKSKKEKSKDSKSKDSKSKSKK